MTMRRHGSRSLAVVVLLLLGLHGAATRVGSAEPAGRSWLEGRLLVASQQLDDPNFVESVVYLVRHGPDGAFGLIVNRRIAVGPLGRLLESMGRAKPKESERTIALYDGGPVARDQALLLHGDDYAGPMSLDAGHGLKLTPADPFLDDLAAGKGPRAGLLIVGHAGWGAGQLEQEIAEGAWHVVDADARFVLDPEVQGKWRRALAREGHDL